MADASVQTPAGASGRRPRAARAFRTVHGQIASPNQGRVAGERVATRAAAPRPRPAFEARPRYGARSSSSPTYLTTASSSTSRGNAFLSTSVAITAPRPGGGERSSGSAAAQWSAST